MSRSLGLLSICLLLPLLCSCSLADRYAPSAAYEDGYVDGYRNGLAEAGLKGYSPSRPGSRADSFYLQGWLAGCGDAVLATRSSRSKAAEDRACLAPNLPKTPAS